MGDAGGTVEVVDGLVGGVEGEAVVLVVVEVGHVADERRPGGLAPEGVVLGYATSGLHPSLTCLRAARDRAEVVQVSGVGVGCDLFASGAGVIAEGGFGLVDFVVVGPGLCSGDRSALCLLLAVVPRVEVGQLLAELAEIAGQYGDVVLGLADLGTVLAPMKRPIVLGEGAPRVGELLLGAAVLTVGLTSPAGEVREVLFVVVEGGLVLVGGGLLADGSLDQVPQVVDW